MLLLDFLLSKTLYIFLAWNVNAAAGDSSDSSDSKSQYLQEWSLHIPGGPDAALQVAQSHDLHLYGEIIPDSNIYHLAAKKRRRRKRENGGHSSSTERLLRHSEVSWGQQLALHSRVKRDSSSSEEQDSFCNLNSDPFWNKMWYLNRENDLNMNVEGAWRDGISGRGVAVTILDDGIEKDHPDLLANYDPLASTDINDNDNDPNPRYDFSNSNRHGTRCAGQVAASPNNSICGVGIAYNAQIGGIRMLDGRVSDAVEARSLSFNPDHIDIYSSSWGPNDDGKTVDGPGKLAHRAFLNGIARGRDGKGSIFVWASGNGGRYKDNCNCDGYATSIYTITVSSTSESGKIPWYSEACASTLATTYSSGTTSERQIVTTDLHHDCTVKHTGTSASAPMAAAIIALALEANPKLTWRDVQHIMVITSRPANLQASDWKMNAMGRLVSHSYGYGLMDTTAMVRTAKKWKLMPEQEKCDVDSPYYYRVIPAMGYVTIKLDVKNCKNIKYLEHVVSPIHVSTGRKRGDLRIYLISPMGTRSTLLDVRPQDYSSAGFMDWPFMSVHSWGENPSGTWTLEIHNDAYSKWASDAKFFRWRLVLYGTMTDPNTEQVPDINVIREVPTESSTRRDDELLKVVSSSSSFEEEEPNDPVYFRGCVSKQIKCTREVTDCRTFNHRSVANILCRCTSLCLEVAASVDDNNKDIFNMQCDMTNSTSSSPSEVPLYCHMIPFFSY